VVSSFLETVALANEEAGMATVFIVASQLTKTVLLLAAALAFGSVRSLIIAALVQGAVQTAILVGYLRSRFGAFWRAFEWRVARMQLAYALPFGVGATLAQFQTDLPAYFVSHEF